MPEYETDFTTVLAELTARIRNLENKYNLLGERVLLVNQTMIQEYKKLIKEIQLINTQLRELQHHTTTTNDTLTTLAKDLNTFATKDQLKILEKYIDLWNPLHFVTEEQLQQTLHEHTKKKQQD